ncbi:MAG: RNA polymerase sigma factor [bacterium]|nr:RNA polymerase sigma factor [bacterium]
MENMINGLKTGKQEAWNMMIDSYSRKVYNLALNFAGNSDDASDITQDIFLKVYNNIDKFQDGSNFTSWLLRLAKNYCIDYWRKNKYNRMRMELDDNIRVKDDRTDAPRTPEDNVIRNSDIKFLRQKLLLLPPDLRTLIIMRDIQDYSYQEISEHLDIPLGTTKSRINRARTKLAKVVLKEGN